MGRSQSLSRSLALIASVGALSSFAGCVAKPPQTSTETPIEQAQQESELKLFWVSLDGLRKTDLEKYLKYVKTPHPRGFQYLLAQQNWNASLEIQNPTITASSHISTITCTPAGKHGVFGNSQWDGSKRVSGFNTEYTPENFVSALKKSGLKVASLGYPSIDGLSENRKASLGVAYDNPTNRGTTLKVKWSEEQTVTLPSRTQQDGSHTVTLRIPGDGSSVSIVNGEEVVTVRPGEWKDVFFTHEGKKHLTVFAYLTKETGESEIYVSPTMLNNVHPESFQERLESKNLVFSPGKDFSLRNGRGEEAFLQSMEHRLSYFTQAAHHILKEEKPEAFFFYLEDLDTLGHQYEGESDMDELRGAFFAKVDQALGSILELIPDSTNVVILGDHGMSSVNYEINAQKLLPQSAISKFVLNTSGGAFFAYGTESALESAAPVNESWFQESVEALRNATVEFDGNRKVFNTVVVKGTDEAKKLGLDGEKSPWIMAFADPGISVKESVEESFLLARRSFFKIPDELAQKFPDPIRNDTLIEPVPFGNHGHIGAASQMKTSLVLFGPLLGTLPASQIELNTGIVPAVADALNLPRPDGCAK